MRISIYVCMSDKFFIFLLLHSIRNSCIFIYNSILNLPMQITDRGCKLYNFPRNRNRIRAISLLLKESLRIAEIHELAKITMIYAVTNFTNVTYTNCINHRRFTSCIMQLYERRVGLSRQMTQRDFSYGENKESGHKRRGLLRDEGWRVEGKSNAVRWYR